MKFEWRKIDENTCEYKITISKEEIGKVTNKARNKIVTSINIPGFRKNAKLPKPLLNKYLTKDRITIEATKFYIEEAYAFALEEAKKGLFPTPYETPSVKVDLAKDFQGVLLFAFSPAIKANIPSLTTLNLKFDETKYKITDKKIEEEIFRMKDEYSIMVLRDEKDPVHQGDTVIIDFQGTIDGQTFEGGSEKNYQLVIGSKKFLPGFEEKIIGMKANEEKKITITFPKDYFIKHLRNLEVEFIVKLHEIRYKQQIKTNKEFIELLNKKDVKTMNDVKNLAKKNLQEKLSNQMENDYWSSLLTKIMNTGDFYYPKKLIDKEFHQIRNTLKTQLESKHLTIDQYVEVMGTTNEKLNASFKNKARNKVLTKIAVSEIIRALGIVVTNNEIVNYGREILKNHKPNYQEKELEIFVNNQKDAIRQVLLEKRAREDVLSIYKRSKKQHKKEPKTNVKPKKPSTKPKAKIKTTKKTTTKKTLKKEIKKGVKES